MLQRNYSKQLTVATISGLIIVALHARCVAQMTSTTVAVPGAPFISSVTPKNVKMDETLHVKVDGLAQWMAKAHTDPSKAVLLLDGNLLSGIPGKFNPGNQELTFSLTRGDASRDSWTALLGSFKRFTKEVTVGVQLDGIPTLSYPETIVLSIVDIDNLSLLCLALFALSVLGFIWLAVKSDILRDSGPPPQNSTQRKTFSLARVQMAIWFFLVLGAYLLIWIITDERDTMSTSALTLLGISSGTALGAVVLDAGKRASAESDLSALKAEQDATQKRIAQIQQVQTPTEDQSRELAEKTGKLSQVNVAVQNLEGTVKPMVSTSFFDDLLSDSNGISLHRFQIFIWTIVLAIIFITVVWKTISMPDFSATLLALMGISNGTYLGFKFPEQQS